MVLSWNIALKINKIVTNFHKIPLSYEPVLTPLEACCVTKILMRMTLQSVAVFCGSRLGKNIVFMKHAAELGRLIATLELKLVYGGGKYIGRYY